MVLSDIFSPRDIKVDLESACKDDVLAELIGVLAQNHPGLNPASALAEIRAREEKMSTAIFPGIAIPHASVDAPPEVLCAIGISRSGIDFDSFDAQPTHIFFLVISGQQGHQTQLTVLQKLSFILNNKSFVTTILEKESPREIYDALCHFENVVAM
jgi:mannitol/fructose-specific phosphotransferase system IIA component (Ntr-type)